MKPDSYWSEDVAHLTYSREGRFLEINQRPLWAIIAEKFGEWLVGDVLSHALCCNMPEWPYKVRWGKLDDDGFTTRSLGHYLYRAASWLDTGGNAWKHFRHVASVPVSAEWIKEHYPELDEWPWKTDDEPELCPAGMTMTAGS